MKRKDFIDAIEKIEDTLKIKYNNYGRTDGLCTLLLHSISADARRKFHYLYRDSYNSSHYLAPLDTEEGLQIRIKYLRKFKRRMLLTFGYLKF